MSPVSQLWGKYNTLFVVVGSDRIEWGVAQGRQKVLSWLETGSFSIAHRGPESGMSLESLLQGVATLLPQLEDVAAVDQVRVLVADSWLAVSSVPWFMGSGGAALMEHQGRVHLAVAGFELASEDVLKLDDTPFGAPRLAIAYPRALLMALWHLAEGLEARLSSVLPFSTAAWSVFCKRMAPQSRVLAILEGEQVIFALGDSQRSSALQDVVVRGRDNGESTGIQPGISELWQRLRQRNPRLQGVEQVNMLDMGGGLPAVEVPGFVSLEWPGADVEEPVSGGLLLAAAMAGINHPLDAVPGKLEWTWGRWISMGLALFFVGFMGLQSYQTGMFHSSLEKQARELAPKVQPPPVIVPWTREEELKILAVNAAIRELNLPIAPILRALQPPQDIRVAVLGVETTAMTGNDRFSRVKITAEAQTGAEMARYVAFVAERKPFTGAYLVRHEVDENQAERPYRFTVEVQWND